MIVPLFYRLDFQFQKSFIVNWGHELASMPYFSDIERICLWIALRKSTISSASLLHNAFTICLNWWLKCVLVYCCDLFEENHRTVVETRYVFKTAMGRLFWFFPHTGSNGGYDKCGSEMIPNIVLKCQHRATSALFRADVFAEVNEVYIATAICPVVNHRLSSFLHSKADM